MGRQENAPGARRFWLVPAAWVSMPVLLLSYLVLRYVVQDRGLAQVAYLAPMMLATAFAVSAAWAASPRTRVRAVWVLLSLAVAASFMSESYFSWPRLLYGVPANAGVLFDTASVVAFGFLVTALVFFGAFDRLGVKRLLRLAFDAGALLVLGFVVIFKALVGVLSIHIGVFGAARLTAYSLAGVLLLVMTAYIFLTVPSDRRRPWTRTLGWGISLLALGVVLWPFWSLATAGGQSSVTMDAVVTSLFMAGYSLVFIAGVYRVVTPEEPWGQALAEPLLKPAAWQGITVSILVLLSVVVLGFAIYDTPEVPLLRIDDYTRMVYYAALTIATVCLVGRTALASLESDELRARSQTDPVTGAPNPRGFEEHIDDRLTATRRFGEPFALILLDLDDFSRVNEVMSLSAGDRVLADVVVAIGKVVGSTEHVFRMSSDEFAVIVPVAGRGDAENTARAVSQAIRTIPVPGGPLTASLGFAVCPDDALQRDSLVSKADGALAWATHHGRGLVIGYDQRVEQALGAGERMRMLEQDTKLGVARALMAAADARDPRSHFHARGVAALSCLLAAELGFEPEHVERLRVASMLHDVGKIALASPSSRDRHTYARQRESQREHCELGERMLASLALPDVARWVRSHHERWDGQGYPDGLKATRFRSSRESSL